MPNRQIMKPDRAAHIPRRRRRMAARAVPEGGVVVVRVDAAAVPITTPLLAQHPGGPVRRVDGRGEAGEGRV